MSSCRTDFDEIKYMSLLIRNEEFLEKYNGIWEIKSCKGKTSTNFHTKKRFSMYLSIGNIN